MSEPDTVARVHRLELEVASLREVVAGLAQVGDRVETIYEGFLRAQGAAEARADLDKQLGTLPGRVETLERRMEATERPVIVHDEPAAAVWRDADGRAWVTALVTRVCIAAVLIAGIMAGIVTTLPEGVLAGLGS